MRVVHITSTSPTDITTGGVEKFVRDLLPALGRKRINPVLFGAVKRFIDRGTKINETNNYEFYPAIITNRKRLLVLRYYLRLLIKGKYVIRPGDIIHLHRLEPLFFLFIYRNPKIVTIHINVVRDICARKGNVTGRIYQIFERFILSRPKLFGINKIIFVSDKLKDEYIHEYSAISKKSVSIRTGIGGEMRILPSEEISKIKEEYGLLDKDFIILSLGRLTDQKNIPLVLDAFNILRRQNKNAVIIVGGSGPAEDEIKKYIDKLKLKNIYFLGNVKQKDIVGLYNIADVFVITSKYEGGPITIYEALSCGCPVISTDVGVAHEVIQNDITGFIVNENSAIAFAEKMKIIRDDRTRFRSNVQKKKSDFSIETIADRYIEIYNSIEGTL